MKFSWPCLEGYPDIFSLYVDLKFLILGSGVVKGLLYDNKWNQTALLY